MSYVVSNVGQRERTAQDRVVGVFRDSLRYEYLGNWETRLGNSNIDVELLVRNLRARGYDDKLINKAVDKIKKSGRLQSAALWRKSKAGCRRAVRDGVADRLVKPEGQ